MVVTAIAAASAARTSLVPSTSSANLVPVDIIGIIVGVSICLRHDNIIFVLYRSMCKFVSILLTVIVISYES